MTITDVKVRRTFDKDPLRAIVSVTFDDVFAVHDIKVIQTKNKRFVVMPVHKNSDGSFRDIYHPICREYRAVLEKAVLDAYDEKVSELSDYSYSYIKAGE